MLKVRYFRFKTAGGITALKRAVNRLDHRSPVVVTRLEDADIVFTHTVSREVQVIEALPDGEEVVKSYPSIERRLIRAFMRDDNVFFSIVDPPRSGRAMSDALSVLLPDVQFFLEPLEISLPLITAHTKNFSSARLVSAKVRDFQVTTSSVGRLEVTSKEGLPEEIAPFLEGKFYRLDSVAYEVTHDFTRGLITYSSNGTVRVSGPLVDVAFPSFESVLR